jgi:hypothetical protein
MSRADTSDQHHADGIVVAGAVLIIENGQRRVGQDAADVGGPPPEGTRLRPDDRKLVPVRAPQDLQRVRPLRERQVRHIPRVQLQHRDQRVEGIPASSASRRTQSLWSIIKAVPLSRPT